MKKNTQILLGIVLTIVAFIISIYSGNHFHLKNSFIPYTFMTHVVMLITSIALIYSFKNYLGFKLEFPKLKNSWKPFLYGLLAALISGIITNILTMIFTGSPMSHPAMSKMNPLQIFIFVFLLASFTEELLFRGFLQNMLHPLKSIGFKIFNRFISLPVILSGLIFGLGHLVLLYKQMGLGIFIFTTLLGLIAGYYQEKHNNTSYAILVHMGANLVGLIVASVMYYS